MALLARFLRFCCAGSAVVLLAGVALAAAPPPYVPRYEHVVVVVMENHSADAVLGNPAAPWINALAAAGANFTAAYGVTHPSQPNYLALFSGSTQGVTDDSCPVAFSGVANLASQLLAAGRSFVGYSEDLPAAADDRLNGAERTRLMEAERRLKDDQEELWRAYRIARKVRAGTFSHNIFRFDPSLPFGGFKDSGIGREGGAAGVRRDGTEGGQEDGFGGRLVAQRLEVRCVGGHLGPTRVPGALRQGLPQCGELADPGDRVLALGDVGATDPAQVGHRELLRQQVERQRAIRQLLRQALPRNAALVAYARSQNSYLAFVLDVRGVASVVNLGQRDRIDNAVQRWRAEIALAGTALLTRGGAADHRCYLAGAALRSLVWDPLAESLRSASLVLLVPDGALQWVSFGALPADESRFLVETAPTLHLLAAERDVVVPSAPPRGSGLLAVADPLFFAGSHYLPLPGTRAEVDDIMKLWRTIPRAGEVTLLQGASATKQEIMKQAPGRRVLHFATHGFADNVADPLDALRHSGIVLSGPSDNDRLTAEELATLDLSTVSWVVLSACDTARASKALSCRAME